MDSVFTALAFQVKAYNGIAQIIYYSTIIYIITDICRTYSQSGLYGPLSSILTDIKADGSGTSRTSSVRHYTKNNKRSQRNNYYSNAAGSHITSKLASNSSTLLHRQTPHPYNSPNLSHVFKIHPHSYY